MKYRGPTESKTKSGRTLYLFEVRKAAHALVFGGAALRRDVVEATDSNSEIARVPPTVPTIRDLKVDAIFADERWMLTRWTFTTKNPGQDKTLGQDSTTGRALA